MVTYTSLVIGIGTKIYNSNYTFAENYPRHGMLNRAHGNHIYVDGEKVNFYNPNLTLKAGDIIDVYIDMNARLLSYSQNGSL